MPDKIEIEDVGGHAILKTEVSVRKRTAEEAELHCIDPDGPDNRVWMKRTFDLTLKRPMDWGVAPRQPGYVRVWFEDCDTRILRMSHQAFEREWLRWLQERPTKVPGLN